MKWHRFLCIVDAVIDMQERGFDLDFNLTGNRLLCAQQALLIGANDFEILEMHYFPRSRQSSCERMVYGICVPSCGMKGILILGTDKYTAFPEVITLKLGSYVSGRRIGIQSRLL
ncbi:hypothetical protein Q4E93_29770 [Flavitalea sp. BT771]|uniref:hypothetical protein n=1 Tax=Flavitalea sp. BT771 TaxID=3063329 RepID=UPI0026E3048F|nr:hypothetical protein [Flavitalea sp. BT771]MDO6434838.1 hypothetical protein [Flavitalea sp. BT771]MDV6223738.1 hypothetical protein [Flavitalea sp. BT771]